MIIKIFGFQKNQLSRFRHKIWISDHAFLQIWIISFILHLGLEQTIEERLHSIKNDSSFEAAALFLQRLDGETARQFQNQKFFG